MMDKPRILVVDDDRLSRQTTVHQLATAGYAAEGLDSAVVALDRLPRGGWDVVLTDLRMPGMDGVTFIRELKRLSPGAIVILMTAYGTVESAVAAMKAGAADYLTKPFRFPELELRLQRLWEADGARRELARLREILGEMPGGIVGRSRPIQRLQQQIALFADHDAPVLITGETGTGKELVARAIHDQSSRRRAPFIAVACGAVPHDLAESTFFGHERGAFTGAAQRRKGCFEQADGGTLLLDDVDDLPADIQVKLLRVLQEGVLTRVGGTDDVGIDVRLVATSKVSLEQEVQDHHFRSDLYYRLRGLELNLPPLRERDDDVLILAHHFLKLFSAASGRPPAVLGSDARSALRAHSWPGNVRELRRAMEAADVLARGGEIGLLHLPSLGQRAHGQAAHGDHARLFTLHLEPGATVAFGDAVRHFEDELIAWAMREADGRQTRAAELLGLPRTTLQSRLCHTDKGR